MLRTLIQLLISSCFSYNHYYIFRIAFSIVANALNIVENWGRAMDFCLDLQVQETSILGADLFRRTSRFLTTSFRSIFFYCMAKKSEVFTFLSTRLKRKIFRALFVLQMYSKRSTYQLHF